MAARLTQVEKDKHKTARLFGGHIGRLVAKITGKESQKMATPSGQLAAAKAREFEQEISGRDSNTDLVFRMEPLSRRPVKLRVLGYRDAEPRFSYDEMNEEPAAAK